MSGVEQYPWLTERWTYLARLYDQARLPHAILLNGPQGLGKSAFARAFADYLLCQQRAGNRACGQCKSCQLSDSEAGHPDLYTLAPDEPGKPIKVDQVRELGEFIYSTAQQGGYRLVIIEPAHDMNIAAANALLKTLEEPGRDTILLLVTHRLGQVMPTIKSRCQRLDIAPPVPEIAVPWVADRLDIEPHKAEHFLATTNGSPLEALKFADDELRELRKKLVAGLADLLKRRRTLVEIATEWQKLDLEKMLSWLHGLLGDLARLVVTDDEALLRHSDAANMLRALARRVSPPQLFSYTEQVTEARRSLLLRQNPNKQLLVESLLLGWTRLAQG